MTSSSSLTFHIFHGHAGCRACHGKCGWPTTDHNRHRHWLFLRKKVAISDVDHASSKLLHSFIRRRFTLHVRSFPTTKNLFLDVHPVSTNTNTNNIDTFRYSNSTIIIHTVITTSHNSSYIHRSCNEISRPKS